MQPWLSRGASPRPDRYGPDEWRSAAARWGKRDDGALPIHYTDLKKGGKREIKDRLACQRGIAASLADVFSILRCGGECVNRF